MNNDIGFEQFFRGNYSNAYYLALRLLHDEEASRDVVSDAFEQMLIAKQTTGEEKCTQNYLMIMVKNKCLNHIRKQHTHDKYAKTLLTLQEPDDTEDLAKREHDLLIDDIIQSIDELTPKTQMVLKACFVERKKYSEAADEMGISKSAVKKHIMNGLSHLRKKFKRE